MDSWHNIWTLEPGNERQLLGLILNIALDQIPLDPACPATAKSLVGVERDKKLKILVKSFCEEGNHPCSSYGISIFHSKYCQLPEKGSGNGLWPVHGLTPLTRAALLGPRNGQWDSPAMQVRGQAALFQTRKM